MPTMAIAWAILCLPHHRMSRGRWTQRTRRNDRLDLLTLLALEPPARVHPHSSKSADDCQGKEQSEDHVGHHQQSIDRGYTEAERDLLAPPFRCCRRIGHHVERVEDESDAR